MKKCNTCNKQKEKSAFAQDKSQKDNLQKRCRQCKSEYNKNHYLNNKNKYKQNTKKQRQKVRDRVNELKNKPCADCKIWYPYYVMDFDHLKDKECRVAILMNNAGWDRIKAEIDKCEVVCANCHRERTFKRARKNNTPMV